MSSSFSVLFRRLRYMLLLMCIEEIVERFSGKETV